MIELRPYQRKGLQMLYDSIRAGNKRILWVFPTGAGKSTIASRFVQACVKNNKRVLFFVHSKELVAQFSQRLLRQFGIPSGVIMAGIKPQHNLPVQVASVQTLTRRNKPQADAVIVDESHRAMAKTYSKILEHYPDSIVIGLTATPYRADGKGLGNIFEDIVHPVKIRELINMGFLVPTKVVAPAGSVDMEGVKVSRGDYVIKEMKEKFEDGSVTRGVVQNYQDRAKGKKAIVFNVDVEHSKEMNQRFLDAGIRSAHLDGETPKADRERIVEQFRAGQLDVLHNVMLFTEGFDIPDTEVVILNRATKSEALYVQMVGRGLRPAPGKEECLVLDHGGNTLRFGYVEDYDHGKFSLTEEKKESSGGMKCKKCEEGIMRYRVSEKKYSCPQCGHEYNPQQTRTKKFSDGSEFTILDRDEVLIQRLINMPHNKAKEKLPLSQIRLYAALKGYKSGWWFHTAIDECGVEVMKEDPNAFHKVRFQVRVAEIEGDTHELYKTIKSQIDGRFSREERPVLQEKSFFGQ